MKTIRFIFRLLAFPFVFAIIVIASVRNIIYTSYKWLSKGGDLTVYDETFNPTKPTK